MKSEQKSSETKYSVFQSSRSTTTVILTASDVAVNAQRLSLPGRCMLERPALRPNRVNLTALVGVSLSLPYPQVDVSRARKQWRHTLTAPLSMDPRVMDLVQLLPFVDATSEQQDLTHRHWRGETIRSVSAPTVITADGSKTLSHRYYAYSSNRRVNFSQAGALFHKRPPTVSHCNPMVVPGAFLTVKSPVVHRDLLPDLVMRELGMALDYGPQEVAVISCSDSVRDRRVVSNYQYDHIWPYRDCAWGTTRTYRLVLSHVDPVLECFNSHHYLVSAIAAVSEGGDLVMRVDLNDDARYKRDLVHNLILAFDHVELSFPSLGPQNDYEVYVVALGKRPGFKGLYPHSLQARLIVDNVFGWHHYLAILWTASMVSFRKYLGGVPLYGISTSMEADSFSHPPLETLEVIEGNAMACLDGESSVLVVRDYSYMSGPREESRDSIVTHCSNVDDLSGPDWMFYYGTKLSMYRLVELLGLGMRGIRDSRVSLAGRNNRPHEICLTAETH